MAEAEAGKILDAGGLPSSAEAEKAVLGAMLLDNGVIDIVASTLTTDHFYQPRHQNLFRVMAEMHERGMAVDHTTLAEELRRRRLLDDTGGSAYIARLPDYVFAVGNVEQHVRIITEKFQLRELIRAAQVIQEGALQERDEAGQLLDQAEHMIFTLSQERTRGDFSIIGDLAMAALQEIEQRSKDKHEVSGVETGYTQLDHWTGGFQKSDLLILAARPSLGKTSLALNIALNVGAGLRNLRFNSEIARPVGIFSLEMSSSQINARMLSTLSRVSMHKMRTGHVSADDKEHLYSWARALQHLPIYVDDTPALTIIELRAKARRLMSREKTLSLLIVDYLQLMRSGGRVENRQQEISEISRSLKALARELNVPILALSQLNRAVEQRRGKQGKPMLSDLRESGAIEQDADVVMFIHRERKYESLDGDDHENPDRPPAEPTELIIAKQRNGPTGTIDLVFFHETATFHNVSRHVEAPGQDSPDF